MLQSQTDAIGGDGLVASQPSHGVETIPTLWHGQRGGSNHNKKANARNIKAYISIFMCFVTKAVHIELMSDLTSKAFIGTLRRLISRKG